jgi:hypothetical protein
MKARPIRAMAARLPLCSCTGTERDAHNCGTTLPAAAVPHKFLSNERLLIVCDIARYPSSP